MATRVVVLAALAAVLVALILRWGQRDVSCELPRNATNEVLGIRFLKLSTPPRDSRSPRDCDLLDVRFRLPGAFDASAGQGWQQARFAHCQLPPRWRAVVEQVRIGEEVEYWVPRHLVPDRIASMLRTNRGSDLHAVMRIEEISDPPPELDAPTQTQREQVSRRLGDGTEYRRVERGDSEYRVRESSLVFVEQSVWTSDQTLIGSTILFGAPTVIDLRKADEFWPGVLTGATEGDRFVVRTPEATDESGEPLIIDVRVTKVLQ